ncbi:MAG: DUF2460 domain-containing protein [Qipengyuania sp.]
MAFWLVKEREGQDSDVIQRFDPRFWTVDFPRPMMASLVTTAPDALRVECEFHHAGELAGLIWESEDRFDHPLLAYEIHRDYSHTVLRFRWRSGGIVALDQPNGPTLTIEGRDSAGNAKSWFVRLWNYASGSPQDAHVELRFSELEDGYTLPGDRVHPADIDRMFTSLVPPGFAPESVERLPARADGWAELSDIECYGDHAMVTVGDVILPTHGEQIATAYDDAYNQAPARLVRQIEQLGYRGRVIHYVGMSHFFRLAEGAGADAGRLLAAADASLCEPARRWHEAFFAALGEAGLEPIVSLSYELLADHCPQSWQQTTLDTEPARTGWYPPSALLSPANDAAMGWLRAVAANFVALADAAGHPVRFQIGEPWWWVMADGRPCIYDDAALAIYNAEGLMTTIPTLRMTLYPPHHALLDRAGEILAQSTAALAQAVRDAAGGPAEVLLLLFTPTLLDPEMPELKRASLPVGWAWPAFDRLQLEDYDWLTAGADAARRTAWAEVDARLGFPIEQQDYLAGFVLNAGDADTYWPRIDAALDEAAGRGVTQRFVWALPQIARDGYTRLAPPTEDDVNAFDDVAYPLALGRDASAGPEFSTSIALTASGHERRNALWTDARMRYDVGPGIRSEAELGVLLAFFRARHGPATGFRLRDPYDFSSNGMTRTPTAADQLIGTGDGLRSTFRLVKNYGEQVRPITRPDAATVVVSVAGATTTSWTLGAGGMIAFDTAPADGAEIRAGFLFDVPVRFAEDRLDISGLDFAVGEAPSVPLVEIRESA